MNNDQTVELQAFKMYDRLYFVGTEEVSVHLIDTEEGLVLIDTGYPNMYDDIINNIKKMGYDPKNIVAIFHTHGHIDHFGCTQRLVEISGAKTYISRIDNDIVNGKLDLSWCNEIGMEHLPFFDCDVLVEDGDVFSFGNTTIKCVLTPGHTAGVLSLFITLEDNGKKIVAAMHGGIGFNSMEKNFLEKYGLSFSCRTQFKESLGKLTGKHVDIVLGNHPEQTKTLQKMIKVFSGESIVDPDEWQNFIQYNERRINKFLREHPEQ